MNRIETKDVLLLVLGCLYLVLIGITKTMINDELFTNILAFVLIAASIGATLFILKKVLR